MEINKLLMLTSPGGNKVMVDVKTQATSKVMFTNIDVYVTIAEDDLTAINKDGKTISVKKGDYIVKSNCRGILASFNQNASLKEFVDEMEKQYPRNEKVCANDYDYDEPVTTAATTAENY